MVELMSNGGGGPQQQQQQQQQQQRHDPVLDVNADGSAKNPAALMSRIRSNPEQMRALEVNSQRLAK